MEDCEAYDDFYVRRWWRPLADQRCAAPALIPARERPSTSVAAPVPWSRRGSGERSSTSRGPAASWQTSGLYIWSETCARMHPPRTGSSCCRTPIRAWLARAFSAWHPEDVRCVRQALRCQARRRRAPPLSPVAPSAACISTSMPSGLALRLLGAGPQQHERRDGRRGRRRCPYSCSVCATSTSQTPPSGLGECCAAAATLRGLASSRCRRWRFGEELHANTLHATGPSFAREAGRATATSLAAATRRADSMAAIRSPRAAVRGKPHRRERVAWRPRRSTMQRAARHRGAWRNTRVTAQPDARADAGRITARLLFSARVRALVELARNLRGAEPHRAMSGTRAGGLEAVAARRHGPRCGGAGCENRVGGRGSCCAKDIVRANRSCDEHAPPCVLRPRMLQRQTHGDFRVPSRTGS